ncbi:MAG: PTS system mannose/fructose/sorbose family transporter subunit IID [Deltaproteobacteria bacterium]|jgi:PTS system mannose-specific IID component|nr:PTS system mannose/fructose/sorbose family transporter subunit IID [Deltaproteobacteria bacterium]
MIARNIQTGEKVRPGKLSGRSALLCFVRSGMVNLAYNLRGLQNIGFTYAIIPGLRDIHHDGEAFRQSCLRYAEYHNCNPVWSSFLVGAFLHTETRIASGQLDAEQLKPLKDATLNSLSAIGDSFFSGSLETVFFLLLACMVVKEYLTAACIGLVIWLLAHLLARLFTFYIGLSRGLAAVGLLRSFNLVNIGDYLKIFGALTLVALLTIALHLQDGEALVSLTFKDVALGWVLPVCALLALGTLDARWHYPRLIMMPLALLILSIGA